MSFSANLTRQKARGRSARFIFCALLTVIGRGAAPGSAEPAEGIAEQPLAPRFSPRGKTMFVRAFPQQTGIVTTNDYP